MSQRLSLPFSCPVTMNWSSAVHAATVAFPFADPPGVIVKRGSVESASAPLATPLLQARETRRTLSSFPVDLKDANSTLVSHPLLRHRQHLPSPVQISSRPLFQIGRAHV